MGAGDIREGWGVWHIREAWRRGTSGRHGVCGTSGRQVGVAHQGGKWAWYISEVCGHDTSGRHVGAAHQGGTWAWHISEARGRGTSVRHVGGAHQGGVVHQLTGALERGAKETPLDR